MVALNIIEIKGMTTEMVWADAHKTGQLMDNENFKNLFAQG